MGGPGKEELSPPLPGRLLGRYRELPQADLSAPALAPRVETLDAPTS